MSLTLTVGSGHGFTTGDTVLLDGIQWLCPEGEDVALDTDTVNGGLYLVIATDTTTITVSLISATQSSKDFEPDFANDVGSVTFNTDGTKAWVLGFQGGAGVEYQIKEYALSTAYDISTAGAAAATFTLDSGAFSPDYWDTQWWWDDVGATGFTFNMTTDGGNDAVLRQYLSGATTVNITDITQANPGVVTTSAAHSLSVDDYVVLQSVGGMTEVNDTVYQVNTVPTTTTLTLKPKGGSTPVDTTLFTAYTSGGTVRKLTPYDTANMTLWHTHSILADITLDLTFNAQPFLIDPTGTRLWAVDQASILGTRVEEYAMSTAWDLSTIGAKIATHNLPADADSTNGAYVDFAFSSDGSCVYWATKGLTTQPARVDLYSLSTAYDLSTIAATKTSSFLLEETFTNVDDGIRTINIDQGGTTMSIAVSVGRGGTPQNLIKQFTVEDCALPASVAVECDYLGGGTVTTATTSLDELWHLEGEEVCVVVDGVVDCTYTVTNGSVSGWALAGRVHVGLPFITDIETLNITQNDGDASQHQTKSVSRVTLRFFKSLDNVQVGPDVDNLTTMDVNTLGTDNAAILIGDGDYEDREIYIQPVWNSNGRVHIRQTEPSPLTILAVIPEFEAQDDQQGQFG